MSLTHLNPATMHRNPAFSQGVVIEPGSRVVVVGGQNGVDATGTVVGPGLRAEGGLGRRGGDSTEARSALPSLRYLLNMIEEYARHNGHADRIRESEDGLVGHDPPS